MRILTSMKKKKRFIVRKYVMAYSASDALKRELDIEPDGVWIDDEWIRQSEEFEGTKITGFGTK